MEYGIFSFNEFIYSDTPVNNKIKDIDLTAAKNSFLCTQIIIKEVESVNIDWNGDFNAPEIFQMIPVHIARNHGSGSTMSIEPGSPCDYAARVAPFDVYDPLEPVDGINIKPDTFSNIVLYLRWSTKNAKAGNYTGTLNINEQQISVKLNIANVTVPQKETLRVTNWYDINSIANGHNVEPWSEEHWDLIEKYGRIMRHCRQTDFWTSNSFQYKKDENGEFVFDFSRLNRLIDLYLSLGFTHIEGTPIITRKYWGNVFYYVNIDGELISALSDEGMLFIKNYFTQFYDFICKKGLKEITQHHICDEPHSACAEDYVKLSKIIKEYIPGIKIIEAVETTDVYGSVDTWVTTIKGYEESKDKHEEFKKNGVEFWYYTCCYPGGNYLNRFLDNELIRTRYLHWANYIYDFKGYLHWGLNFYFSNSNGSNPYAFSTGKIDEHMQQILPPGDTHIVYPKGNQILSSARIEMMRAGIEDYELIKILSEKDKYAADKLVEKCVRSFTDYSLDIKYFEEVYKELLELV